jgi:hypothetical protein
VATPNATPEASATPEAAATDAPVIEVTIEAPDNSVSSEAYDSMLTSLTVIFLALLGTVGAVGGVGVWRAIGILLIVVEVWARFTDNKNDDVEVAKWRKPSRRAWQKRLRTVRRSCARTAKHKPSTRR